MMRPLKELFWSEMDDILGQMLLLGEDHRPFAEFVDYTLWICGSSISMGIVESNASSNSLAHITSSAVNSLSAPA